MSKGSIHLASIPQQISLLRSRGMEVSQEQAEQWLSVVSSYRLSAYWFPARTKSDTGARTYNFKEGTKFCDVVSLYEADRKLRTLIHDGIERVEVAVRTRIIECCSKNSPTFYMQAANFRPTFDHEHWLSTANRRVARARRHSSSINHDLTVYGSDLPFWILAEVLDFSDISRLFEGMFISDQRRIAESLGIYIELGALSDNQKRKVKRVSPFARWLEQLTVIRNTSAHHGRLWNRSFAPAPTSALRTQPELSSLPVGQSERIFGALVVMSHLMRVISPGTTWPDKLSGLLHADFFGNPLVDKKSLGISDSWTGFL